MKLMKVYSYIFIMIFLVFLTLKAEKDSNNICKGILSLSPNITLSNCREISEIINKYSKEYQIAWQIPVAIFKKESDFNYQAVNYKSNDFGIGQINSHNMKYYKFDLGRQLTDIDYAIRNTFIMLDKLKKYKTGSKGHLQWFTRYHSFTKKIRYIYFYAPLTKRGLKKYLDILNFKGGVK